MAHHVHDVTPEPGNYTSPGDVTEGLPVDGENGLLAQLTRLVLESALEGELTAHALAMTGTGTLGTGPGQRRC